MTDGGGTGGIRAFYDALAPDYDLMTSFDARFAKERPWFDAIVLRNAIGTALDAGCGTGFHTILLSRLGVTATGVDASPAMIELARRNAVRLGAAVTFHAGEFSEVSRLAPGPFDAVFCLGNSLPHLLTESDLVLALSEFRGVLRPGGLLLAQLLNYERILAEGKALQGRREAGGTAFERRYTYQEDRVTFTLSRGNASASVPLRPLTRLVLGMAFDRAGFRDVQVFGDLAMGVFDPAVSTDLVLVTRLRAAS